MKYQEIKQLLEYDRTKTQQALGNGIVAAAAKDRYLTSKQLEPEGVIDAVIKQAEAADPTANKQNVQWIVKQFIKQGIKYEDMYKLKADLTVFAKTKGQHKRLGINSDINSYNWKTLAVAAQKLDNTDLAEPADPTQDAGPVADAKVLYNGPLGILSIPGTEAASCELGKGTKWCTSSTGDDNENMFDYYSDKGSLYVWQDKKLKTKFQFHFETGQFMDAQDNAITGDSMNYLTLENPVTSKLFKKYGPTTIDTYIEYIEALYNDEEYDEMADEEILDVELAPLINGMDDSQVLALVKPAMTFSIKDTDSEQFRKVIFARVERNPALLKKAQASERFNSSYVHHKLSTLGQDDAIKFVTTHDEINPYVRNRAAFNLASKAPNPVPELEEIISKDAHHSLLYAINILKRRFPEGEAAIKKTEADWKTYQEKLGFQE
jgi:hypothetical protein